MSGSFEDVLGEYEAPTAEDIVIPHRVRDAKPEGSEKPTGDKGGNATSPDGAPADSQGASAPTSAAPEPAPQLPEGSDVDEDEPENAAEDDQVSPEVAPEDSDENTDAVPDDAAPSSPPESELLEPESPTVQEPVNHPVIPRKGGALSFEGESAYLKQFPRVLIDQMREILQPRLGAVFARDLSQVSIVTAFVMASMGTEIKTDESTAEAVRAFRENDPKTDAIEKRTALLLEQQAKLQEDLKKVATKLGEVVTTTTILEVGQAYAIAERTAQLDTHGLSPENLDITQKRAIASRDNIRRRVSAQQQEEKTRAGRPFK